ncbi:MAG: AraC family transcriptional regulator [Granulosicoccus sp.]
MNLWTSTVVAFFLYFYASAKTAWFHEMALIEVKEPQDDATYEQISIPTGASFLWRCDDYPWARNVWNYHPEIEIHLVRKSSGLTYVGDYIGNFEPGNLSMVGGFLPHNWISLPAPSRLIKERDIVLQFLPETFINLSSSIPELSELDDLFNRAALGIEFSGETAIAGANILESMKNYSGIEKLARMIELLALLTRSKEAKTLASSQFALLNRRGTKHDIEMLELALTYMQDNFISNPNLSEVSSLVGMSDTKFSRFFKKQTGNTYTNHLTTLRLWAAKRQLRETDTSITRICFESGFSNISNFNRTFLKNTGMRPLAYRKAAKQRE